jgi:hypothetical protein
MEKVTYTLVGKLDEIVNAIDVARTENRFLSDEENVIELAWSLQDEDIAQAEIEIVPDKPIKQDELALFTGEYPSIVITVSFDDVVQSLVSGGEQEQVA